MNIREQISEIIERDLHPIPEEKRDCSYKFYYRDYKDNLIYRMDSKHKCEYCRADGGEMEPNGAKPAKMASVTSSSAMTFNLLGNRSVTVKSNCPFSPGRYEICYEKQLYTLNKGSKPANLDAFLSNEDTGKAIFCEMKMLEWLAPPHGLKAAYCDRNSYFDPDSYDEVFSKIIHALRETDVPDGKNMYASRFRRYDAWQMFKHTLAIYNAASKTTKDRISQKTGSIAGKYNKITLANVVFEMDTAMIGNGKLADEYTKALALERYEARDFINTMCETGLKNLFKNNCGVEFDICYISAHEFAAMFEKSQSEIDYLKRYCCK